MPAPKLPSTAIDLSHWTTSELVAAWVLAKSPRNTRVIETELARRLGNGDLEAALF